MRQELGLSWNCIDGYQPRGFMDGTDGVQLVGLLVNSLGNPCLFRLCEVHLDQLHNGGLLLTRSNIQAESLSMRIDSVSDDSNILKDMLRRLIDAHTNCRSTEIEVQEFRGIQHAEVYMERNS